MRTVCGLDIHKDSIFMCIMDEQGKKSEKKFGVSTREVKSLSMTLKSHHVSEVCMESTGIYWKPIWHLLENDFRLYLVNPQFIKQLPGRKSDVKDAEWIATVLLKNLVRNSFVPTTGSSSCDCTGGGLMISTRTWCAVNSGST